MIPIEHELEGHITSGNYQQGFEMAQKWLESFGSDSIESAEYKKALEAFVYCKFFFDRSERIYSLGTGRERAELFIKSLEQLKNLREKHDLVAGSEFWEAIQGSIHQEIAQNLAKAMAGQKAYNLDEGLILHLVYSLIELQNYKGAKDALYFLHSMNSRSATVNLLLAFVSYQLRERNNSSSFLREALFINPDILKENLHFLPGGDFRRLWDELEDMPAEIKCRNFALLAEVNALYEDNKSLNSGELKKIENDHKNLYKEYHTGTSLQTHILPRLLHYLTWLIQHFRKNGDMDKADHYEVQMRELDPEIHKLYRENFNG